jgi:hypothetical protein
MRSSTCAWIVTSRAVVGSSANKELRIAGERHRDHHALAHAAGELMRIGLKAPRRVGDPDEPEQLDDACLALLAALVVVEQDGLADLVPNRHHGIERAHGLLEHHGDVAAADVRHAGAREIQEVDAFELDPALDDPPRRLRDQAQYREGGDRLARS